MADHAEPKNNSRASQAAEQRRDRAAQKLRENLLRRKQQTRARRQGAADETDGLPASKRNAADKS